jgi:hypothetical protein
VFPETANDWSSEETDDPLPADRRNFNKVEKWSRDGLRVGLLIQAGNDLDGAARHRAHHQAPAAHPAETGSDAGV